jgi:tetratricopeptide (TPR) repeat protein
MGQIGTRRALPIVTWRRSTGAFLLAAAILVANGASAAADDFESCAKASGDRAIAACTRAIDSGEYEGKDLASLFYNRGWELDEKGEYRRAIADYGRAIDLNPRANYYTNRGLAYSSLDDLDRAIEDYDEAIRLDAKHATAWNNRGVAYEKKGDLPRALRNFNEAIRLDPDYKKAIDNRRRVNDTLRKRGN